MALVTYASENSRRTALHNEEEFRLTVFQGLDIVRVVDVAEDITPGEVWAIIHASVPEAAQEPSAKPVIRFNPETLMHEVIAPSGERVGMANREEAARLIRRKLIQRAVALKF